MGRLLLLTLFTLSLSAQAPPITGVGYDAVTTTSARIHWTAGFYHDTASDTTLTTGFTTTGTQTITVGSTAGWQGWADGHIPSTLIIGGKEWGRVAQVLSGTTASVELSHTGFFGAGDTSETHYQTRTGLSISVSAGTATATLPYDLPAWWVAGHMFLIRYCHSANLCTEGAAITSVPDKTHFKFATTAANGTYDTTTDPDIWLESTAGTVHASGETVSMLGSDNMVCYGDPDGPAGTYTHAINTRYDSFVRVAQSTKHWEYVTGQTPGSTIHYIVLSTPRQFGASNCSSAGPHTGKSADQTIPFPASESPDPIAPTGVSFSTALPGSYADSVTTAADCSDLQAKLNAARSTAGNHEIKVPAGSICTAPAGGWKLPPQSNGSLVTTIRSAAADAELPVPGACLPPSDPATATPATSPCTDNPTFASHLATLQTPHAGGLAPVFSLAPYTTANDIHLGPGLKIQSDPYHAYNYGSAVALVDLSHNQGDGLYGHAFHPQNFVIDRIFFYQKNLSSGARGAVYWAGGNSIAVVDCVVQGIGNVGQDFGGLNLADQDLSDGGYIIKNNRIQGGSMDIFLGDAGWNTKNGIIQRNWLQVDQSWRNTSPTYPMQRQYPVASITTGNPTKITLAEESDLNVGYSAPRVFNFTGATGDLASKLNAKEFSLTDGSLTDFNCDGTHCIASTGSPHGFTSGDSIWVSGLANAGLACNFEIGAHQVTVTDATHIQYASSRKGHCIYPDVHVLGPVFVPTASSNTTFTIPLDSTSGQITGSITARHGFTNDFKNGFEFKSAKLWDISGNIIDGVFAGAQEGQCVTLTNRISGAWQDINNVASLGTISDINIHDNWCRSSTMFQAQLGVQDNGTSIPMNRVKFSNNLGTNMSAIYCEPGQTCGNYVSNYSSITNNFVFDHNTILAPSGVMSPSGGSTPPPIGNWTHTSNIFMFGGFGFQGPSDVNGVQKMGGQLYQTTGTCTNGGPHPCSLANPPFPDKLWTWGQNALIGSQMDGLNNPGDDWGWGRQYYNGVTAGSMTNDYQTQYWPHGISGVGFAGLRPITGASNTAPIVVTTGAMSCTPGVGDLVMVSGVRGNLGANGTWVVKAATSTKLTLQASTGTGAYTSGGAVIPVSGKCDTSANWALASSSPYRAGVKPIAPATDLSTPGQGPARDGTDLGVNIDKLNSTIGASIGIACSFAIDPSTVNYPAVGDFTLIYVIASAPSCAWSVSNVPDWMIFNPTSGNGTAQITAAVTSNFGDLRRADPIIADQTFSVSQDSPGQVFGSGIWSSVGLFATIPVR